MKALTVHQPWASLIVARLKPFEWRTWPCPGRIVGQRVVIHASARDPRLGLKELLAGGAARIDGSCGPGCDTELILDLLERAMSRPDLMPTRAGLGTARLGKPRLAPEVYRRKGRDLPDPTNTGPFNWGWPMMQVERWDEPVPARGFQGFWPWPYRGV